MFFSFQTIINLIIRYKYFIILPIAMLEGPIISIISGFLVASGFLIFLVTYGVLVLGDVLGDSLYYAIGRFGGLPFIERWGYIFGLNKKRILIIEEHFKEHPKKTLFFGKTQSWGGVILAAAGIGKMPFGRFLWLNFVATLLKSLILILIGYYFGQAYVLVSKYLDYAGIAFAILAIPIIAYVLLTRNREWKK